MWLLVVSQTLTKNELFYWASLGVQWLRLCLPMQGVRVHSLVRKLRSHMPRDQKIKKLKKKQTYLQNRYRLTDIENKYNYQKWRRGEDVKLGIWD